MLLLHTRTHTHIQGRLSLGEVLKLRFKRRSNEARNLSAYTLASTRHYYNEAALQCCCCARAHTHTNIHSGQRKRGRVNPSLVFNLCLDLHMLYIYIAYTEHIIEGERARERETQRDTHTYKTVRETHTHEPAAPVRLAPASVETSSGSAKCTFPLYFFAY